MIRIPSELCLGHIERKFAGKTRQKKEFPYLSPAAFVTSAFKIKNIKSI